MVVEALLGDTPAQRKYVTEAVRRKRADGLAQFQVLANSDNDRLRHLNDDPWADHEALDARPALISPNGRVKFLIMGAGIGGILNAVRLIQAGFSPEQILIVEIGGGVGGTWYWNRYPGLHCDVEAYIYMPLLEEMDYVPSQKYAPGVEIQRHLEAIAKKWKFESRILYRTRVNGLRWDEDARAWQVDMTTGRGPKGQEMTTLKAHAEFVSLAVGLFPHPQYPNLPGLASFEGPLFHTARWHYDVTGGSSKEAFPTLSGLQGKRVGIIGTGATSVQVVPEVAKYAKEVFVFQRTPPQVMVRNQHSTDPTEWRERIASKPGWQKHRMENQADHIAKCAPDDHENLVNDGLTNHKTFCAVTGGEFFGTVTPDNAAAHVATILAMDEEISARVRARVADVVQDEATAAKLTPWYPTWCKRPTFSDTYLQTFNAPHVHLVDTSDTKGVQSVTPTGVVAGGEGTEYPLDILILSTGYRSPGVGAGNPAVRIGIDILGRGGRSLTAKWDAQGCTTLHACAAHGFPNLFWMGPAGAGATRNYSQINDVLSRHVAHIVATAHARAGGWDKEGVVVEVTVEAEEAYSEKVAEGAAYFSGLATCTPSYITNEDEVFSKERTPEQRKMGGRGAPWHTGMVSWIRHLEAWQDGRLEGYEVSVV